MVAINHYKGILIIKSIKNNYTCDINTHTAVMPSNMFFQTIKRPFINSVRIVPKSIIKIDISDFCYQSSPCQHDCTLYYDDNTEEYARLSSRVIYDRYKHLIKDDEISHFKYYKREKVKTSLKFRIRYRLINIINRLFY